MEKILEVKKETRKKIARTYGVSLACVSQALNFRSNSKQCEAIRVMALENGGKRVEY